MKYSKLIIILLISLVFSEVFANEAFITVDRRVNFRSSAAFGTRVRNVIRTLNPADNEVFRVIENYPNYYHVETTTGETGFIHKGARRNFTSPFIPSANEANNPTFPGATPDGSYAVRDRGLLMPMCGCTHERCRMTSPFGMRRHPVTRRRRMHNGVDIGAPFGQIVRAAADGIVGNGTRRSSRGWGNRVVLIHRSGLQNNAGTVISRAGYETQYNHLQRILVSVGERVTQGQPVGTIGSTGLSTGPHLDFNVRANGRYYDPMDFFPEGSVTYSRAFRNTTAACPRSVNQTDGVRTEQ